MSNQKKAIVLGGHPPHIALIKCLKHRNYYTILVDYAESPPAKDYADEHILVSSLDSDAVMELTRNRKAELVITTCSDQANLVACYVAEKLGLPAPYSYETALKVTNKSLMKKIMIKNQIPTTSYQCVSSAEEVSWSDVIFPVVVKPVDSYGSRGVKKASSREEAVECINEAVIVSRNNQAILEQFKPGEEIQADFFIQHKKATLIMTRQRFKIQDSENRVLQSYGSLIPAEISPKAKENLESIAAKIIEAFDLEHTPLLLQAIVSGDEVTVIEFAPRIGGGLSYMLIKHVTGFDILNATIDSFLGQPARINTATVSNTFATVLLYATPGIFDSVHGFQELVVEGTIEKFFSFKSRGQEITTDMASHNRVGGMLIRAENKHELLKKIKCAVDKIEILDVNKEPILKREIYSFEYGDKRLKE